MGDNGVGELVPIAVVVHPYLHPTTRLEMTVHSNVVESASEPKTATNHLLSLCSSNMVAGTVTTPPRWSCCRDAAMVRSLETVE